MLDHPASPSTETCVAWCSLARRLASRTNLARQPRRGAVLRNTCVIPESKRTTLRTAAVCQGLVEDVNANINGNLHRAMRDGGRSFSQGTNEQLKCEFCDK